MSITTEVQGSDSSRSITQSATWDYPCQLQWEYSSEGPVLPSPGSCTILMAGSRDIMAPEIYVVGVGVEEGDVESAEGTKIIITITLNSEMLFAKYTHGACLQIVDIQILVPSFPVLMTFESEKGYLIL